MAAYMYIADNSSDKFINIKNHSYLDGLLIDLQSFAIIPGISDLALRFLQHFYLAE